MFKKIKKRLDDLEEDNRINQQMLLKLYNKIYGDKEWKDYIKSLK